MATEDTEPQKSPFAKLFSPDALRDKELQKIRDRIYSHAWSRDRRDEAKLDWVVSENGVNRNVHLRWIDETSSGKLRHHIDGLPCWLHLANKQISADFTRFIYSFNDLDVLVDLKADHTKPNEAKLDRIVHLLQNTNFQRYTRSARIRIHFPDKYPFEDLPTFNQHALDSVAIALDAFQQLQHFSVRVVPMQGPEIYELRLAAFPFYPMSMTNWSIRMLNSETCNWEFVGGEQLHHLNLAWDLFQETGSLTMVVPAADDAKPPASHADQATGAEGVGIAKKIAVVQQKNGSQKRKDRKLKALSTMKVPNVSKSASETPSQGPSLRSRSTSPDCSKDQQSIGVGGNNSDAEAEPSCTPLPKTESFELPAGEAPDPVLADRTENGVAPQLSILASLAKLESTPCVDYHPALEYSDEALKPENTTGPVNLTNAALRDHSIQEETQVASPSTSVASSVTLGRDQSGDEAAIHTQTAEMPPAETTLRGAGADSDQPVKKKRKSRKKGKKTRATDTVAISSIDDGAEQVLAEPDGNGGPIYFSTVSSLGVIATKRKWEGLITSDNRTFPLADIAELAPWPHHDELLEYTKANGSQGLIRRDADVERLFRQKERIAAQEAERKAEQRRAKEKRKIKKAKEVLIRRKGPSIGLRSRVEDKQQLGGGQQGSDLRKRFSEITGGPAESEVSVSNNSSGDFYSGDEDDPSQENEHQLSDGGSSQRGSTRRYEHLDNISISHHRKDSKSSPSPGSTLPQPLRVFMFSSLDNQGQDESQVEPLEVRELEELDDCVSMASQYGDEGSPLIHDDEDQAPKLVS